MNQHISNILRKLGGNAIEQETRKWEDFNYLEIPKGRRGVNDFGDFCVYDSNGNEIYSENSMGVAFKTTYDFNGNEVYKESNEGFWEERKYDSEGRLISIEDSNGFIADFSSEYEETRPSKSRGTITPEEVLEVVQDNYGISEAVQEYLGWSEEDAEDADGTNWDDVVDAIMSSPKLLKTFL